MPVQEKKWDALLKRYLSLGISIERDIKERSSLGSGKGGQKAQKTANAISLLHEETGLQAASHSSRSKDLNRFLAYRILCEKLEEKLTGKKTAKIIQLEKARKQRKRRKRRSEAKKSEPTDLDTNQET